MKITKEVIIGILIGIIIMFTLTTLKNTLYNKCLLGNDERIKNIIQILVRQSARWSTAAKQDKSPLIAVLHANYGTGYLWALKDIANSEQIELATGIDLEKFKKEVVTIQDNVTKNMAKVCPKYAPKQSYLTKIGGEG